MNNQSIFKLVDIKKHYHRGGETVKAVDGISLSMGKGETLSIVGPSGSGKTTLLNMIGCVDNPTVGSIFINEKDISNANQRALTELRKNTIGFVFQQFFLIPTLTACENVQIPALFARRKDGEKRAKDLLDMMGLGARANHLPAELSGGEMQRVAIARALINEPELILADEPTGSLDSRHAEAIYQTFNTLNKTGISVLIVTHNEHLANLTSKKILIEDGKIVG